MLLIDAYQKYIDDYAIGYYKRQDEVNVHRFNRVSFDRVHPNVEADTITPKMFLDWRARVAQGGLRGINRFVGSRCRTTVNRNHQAFMRAFTWMMTQEIVSTETHYRLAHVPAIRVNRGQAREPEQRDPPGDDVLQEYMEAIKTESFRDLLLLIRHSGLRTEEVCTLMANQIDKTSQPGVWLYSPKQHKTLHLGRGHIIFFGPQAQEIIKRHEGKKRLEKGPLFRNDLGRGWKVQSVDNRLLYMVKTYGMPSLTPRDLRRMWSNEVFTKYGLSGEAATLGHTTEVAQKHYLMRDVLLASQIAREIG